MDSESIVASATDTDEANEVLSLPSTTYGAQNSPTHQHQSSEFDLNFKNDSLISVNKQHQNRNREHRNINQQEQQQTTPLHNNDNNLIDKNACQKLITTDGQKNYNDYVNQNYDGQSKSAATNEDDEEDAKPLLPSDEIFKPKSIVKSPSGNVRPSLPLNGAKGRNKQLSWQATTESERPHVQFNTHDGHDVNTQSSSLDSSDDPATTNNNDEECPSSPISSSSSSDSSSDDEEFSEIQAPDGGWGWVVVFASFMINMIADGITFSFGVYNVEFLKYFGDSKGKTAWIGSIFMATPLLSGPIASYLTDRYGCRKVTIVGSITACIGFLLSAVSDSMEMLFLTFGIIAGVGLSLCYVAAVVIVAYYFDKRRSFATGISVCGSGIGTIIFPPIIQYLISEYGWRGSTVLLAGIFLNMSVCGALMKVCIT